MSPLPDPVNHVNGGPVVTSGQAAVRKTLRVLLADDDPINRMMLSTMLERMGCRYMTAENGVQAVELFQQISFDVVLMDCLMPEMDGYTAAAEIRTLEGAAVHRAFIIALTANKLPEDREKCIAAGMDEHFLKPIQMKKLQQFLEDLPAEAFIRQTEAVDILAPGNGG